jgi:hypothetical protein
MPAIVGKSVNAKDVTLSHYKDTEVQNVASPKLIFDDFEKPRPKSCTST